MDISKISIEYIESLSKKKKYNIQVQALKKFLNSEFNQLEIECSYKEFSSKNRLLVTKDYYFKSDSFTPRQILLISPSYYLYYTKLVFEILYKSEYKKNLKVDFSSERIVTFYSGILEYTLDKKCIATNTTFDKSYNEFKSQREELYGGFILKLDIKDFFNSISIKHLLNKLYLSIPKATKKIKELECFFYDTEISTLPQFHYSMASSVLSQFFLADFDLKVTGILVEMDAKMLRFVDDMYIYKDTPFEKKEYHMLIDKINSLLWQDQLTLNLNKTQLFNNDENFKENYKLIEFNEYDMETDYLIEESVKSRAIEIVTTDIFFDFLIDLNDLYINKGIDIDEYKKKLLEISNDDHTKIFNRIIYKELFRIEFSKLIVIVNNWKFIFFNPSQFTILLIKIINYIEYRTEQSTEIKDDVLNFIKAMDKLTLRDMICTNTFLVQSPREKENILSMIRNVDTDYIKFVDDYII